MCYLFNIKSTFQKRGSHVAELWMWLKYIADIFATAIIALTIRVPVALFQTLLLCGGIPGELQLIGISINIDTSYSGELDATQ